MSSFAPRSPNTAEISLTTCFTWNINLTFFWFFVFCSCSFRLCSCVLSPFTWTIFFVSWFFFSSYHIHQSMERRISQTTPFTSYQMEPILLPYQRSLSPSSFLSAGSLVDWMQSIHPIRLFLSLDVIFVSLTCFASLLVWALFLPVSLPVSLCVVLSVSLVQQMRISQIQWEVTSMLTEPQASVGVMARVGWPVEVKWDCHCGPEGEKAHRATQPDTNTWGCWQI